MWEKQLLQLHAFVKENGHAHVPNGHELSDWAHATREAFARSQVSVERVAALRGFGFCFDASLAAVLREAQANVRHDDDDATWLLNFENLRKYWQERGHAHPRLLMSDAVSLCPLGTWARDQRL